MMKFLPLRRCGALAAFSLLVSGAEAHAIQLPPTDPPNEVSISKQVATAYAAAGTAGSFRVDRTGSVLGDVTIQYMVSGKAVAGQDYTALKGTRTIPQGKDHVTITVHPMAVTGSTGAVKGVRVTLLPGAGYSLSAEVKATVKIVQ